MNLSDDVAKDGIRRLNRDGEETVGGGQEGLSSHEQLDKD